MQNEQKILACVDQSHFAGFVTDTAAWAARRLDAPLQLMHIIKRQPELVSTHDHSGAIGVNAQQTLLKDLSDQDAARSKQVREQGRLFLNQLRERALGQGVTAPDVRQRYGDLEETLVEQQAGVRLFVLGRRGESAETTHRDLGRNVERLVRALNRPILAVTDDFREPQRVMIAFDGGAMTRRGVEMVARSPLFRGLPVHLVMSGQPRRDGAKQLDWARTTLENADLETTASNIPGDTEQVIARYVKEHAIDMLVMGAYGHSPLRSLFFGSKTTDLLRAATIPTLLLR
ncbi:MULTISPECIES: universal stress protein [Thiorhodovibrio]|uniref:universal stress protein n=1 Tax=Thiorhodovibrio TaxID=61593 RepID=UPI0019137C70|nr:MULTISPECIES: universal stress protein [Thiorhodovibrio]MBK5967951.1 universal stress protein A [Thiorhodovibrio winogradskyi]WPL11766.1 Universal stress protein family protein [Thiorhodovibrio litoralis]